MSVRGEEYNNVCVVSVAGDLSGETVVEAQRMVNEALSRHDGVGLVFDLGECEFMDSAGLQMLCQTRRRCEGVGKRVALARIGPTCSKILELTRLAASFECSGDLTRAVTSVR